MQKIPGRFLEDKPCSIVAISCAMKTIGGEIPAIPFRSDGYATLSEVNKAIRQMFNVKKYNYYTRPQRKPLQVLMSERHEGRAIICVLGHYLYADFSEGNYYSFFNNDSDPVVAVWEIE